MHTKRTHFFLLVLLLAYSVSTMGTHLRQTLDISNGLAQNGITSLCKDSRGYLWIGTYDGLNKYNNHDLTTFQNTLDQELFQNNRIHAIAEDRLRRLWIGSETGVTIFDYATYDFQQITETVENVQPDIREIFTRDDRTICVAKSRHIFVYDMEGKLLRCDSIPSEFNVRDALRLSANKYVLTADKGVLYYDHEAGSVTVIQENNWLRTNTIVACGDGSYLLGYNPGIQRIRFNFSPDSNLVKITSVTPILYQDLHVNDLEIDSNNTLWIGCEHSGVWRLDKFEQNWSKAPTQVMSDMRVSRFLCDNEQIWIGSFDKGLVRTERNKSTFYSLENNEITMPQLLLYGEDKLLASGVGGLCIYDKNTQHEVPLPFTISEPLRKRSNILFYDQAGTLWLVTRNSHFVAELHYLRDGRMQVLHSEKLATIKRKAIYETIPMGAVCDTEGNFWIAYLNDLYRIVLTPKGEVESVESIWENEFTHQIHGFSRPRALHYDPETHILWMGTNRKGLFRFDLNTIGSKGLCEMEIRNYRQEKGQTDGLSANFVSAINRTSDGTLWVGTEQGGLCKVTERGDQLSFEVISMTNGLSNNVIKSITEDKYGNLWIGTNIGLNLYNIKEQRITVFTRGDGLKSEDFWYSSLVFPSGEIALSVVNDILLFDPMALYNDTTHTQLHFDDLRVYNEVVHPNMVYNGRVVMRRRFEHSDTLRLNYDENVFSVDIDALSNNNASNQVISYRLAPINDEWIKLRGNNRTIAFNGIEPGRYELQVCEAGNEKVASEHITLHIVIVPPIWKNTHAFLTYIVLFLMIICIVIYAIWSYQSISHSLRIKIMEKSINEDKLRYFSNISHELKTPLSLILAPLAMLKERFAVDAEVNTKLDLIRRQSKKLLDLIELTHGIEANDVQSLKHNPAPFMFDTMIADIAADFEFVAQFNQKTFVISKPEQPLGVYADRSLLEKVISNLLSNASKHTVAGDSITLSYALEGTKMVVLRVADTGSGISADDLPYIFDRFYKAKSASRNIEELV